MKLLAISTSAWNAANRVFYQKLVKQGLDVLLVVPSNWDFGNGVTPAHPARPEDPVLQFLEPSNYHHRLYQLKGIKKLLNNFQPNIIYYEGDPGSVMSVNLGFWARKNKRKFISLSCENLSQDPISVVIREGPNSFPAAFLKYFFVLISKYLTDHLLVINKEGELLFKKMGFKNVVRTPLGFNENVFKINNEARQGIRKKLNIPDQQVVIAYFGRLVYEKGVHLLVEALSSLKEKNWVFMIDQFEGYKNLYQQKIKQLLEEHQLIEKTQFIHADHLEVADYMNAADIVVLPSVSTKKWVEQYGRVVPEALACGKLVVVSDSGAPKDFLKDLDKYIFEEGNAMELKNLIHQLLEAPDLISGKSCERNKIARINFSLEKQVNIFLELVINHNPK